MTEIANADFDEVFNFAVACIGKGWNYDKTSQALGIKKEDHWIIYDAYSTTDPWGDNSDTCDK